MNTYYLVGSILALLFIAYFSFEKYRAYKGDRRFRHSCTNPLCDNDDCEMIYLRMKKPIDPLESRFVRFLSRSDMLCQTQKKCDKEGCVRNKMFWLPQAYFSPQFLQGKCFAGAVYWTRSQ